MAWAAWVVWRLSGMGQKKNSPHSSAGELILGDGERERAKEGWNFKMPITGSLRADANAAARPLCAGHPAGRGGSRIKKAPTARGWPGRCIWVPRACALGFGAGGGPLAVGAMAEP